MEDLIQSIYPNSMIYVRGGEVIISRFKNYYDYYDSLTALINEENLKERLRKDFNQHRVSIVVTY